MKRTFWFGLGVVSGVALTRKASKSARQVTPAGLASNVGDAIRELAGALGSFGADVRAGMSEREQELQEQVKRDTGIAVRPAQARPRAGRHASAARANPRPASRRAPKADA
ncbi:hypothetical protein [Thermocrispum municipale]|jgi:Sec-independent protein translocase protein TatA|uniref:hypothetical protein n=1 Tax=Thermocrispum municipale TaxID=37926 RepID=UPI00048CC287|nr:hypothetical protein [Thermocrispum municipale]